MAKTPDRTFRKYAIVDQGTHWRERLSAFRAAYSNRNIDEIHQDIENKVYSMALDGASLATIADYFGVERNEFGDLYNAAWRAGRAELSVLVTSDTIDYGLKSQIPIAKIWVGKSFAGLDQPKSAVEIDGDTNDSSEVTLNIKVIKKEDQE